jgi:hypothetical protein
VTTPDMIVEGPFKGSYAAGHPDDPPRWIVTATFTSENDAHGFAAWCQSDHPTLASTGPPVVIWRERDGRRGDPGPLPPQEWIMRITGVRSTTDRSTGQGRVEITYTPVTATGPWEPPASRGGQN